MSKDLPLNWGSLKYHPQQYEAFHSNTRFVNLACGRRSGKTELARRKIIIALTVKKHWTNPSYFYALPTFNQAKRVAWAELLKLIPTEWVDSKYGGFVDNTNLHIRTVFGSELYVFGMDQPQRIEGLAFDGGVVDEACDHEPKSFDRFIVPGLVLRNGRCWRIGYVNSKGKCFREFRIFWEMGNSGDYPDIVSYSWPSKDFISAEELAAIRSMMDERDFNEQYNASWKA